MNSAPMNKSRGDNRLCSHNKDPHQPQSQLHLAPHSSQIKPLLPPKQNLSNGPPLPPEVDSVPRRCLLLRRLRNERLYRSPSAPLNLR